MTIENALAELSTRKQIIARHFSHARKYDEHAAIQKKTCHQLLDSLKQTKLHRVLEVGAGTGQLTRLLAAQIQSDHWVINELSRHQAIALQNLLPQAEIRIGDAENIHLGQNFCLIISANAVQWFDNPLDFIIQSYDQLKTSGQLVFNTFTPNNFMQIKQLTGHGLNYPSIDQWQYKLDQIGFRQTEITTHRYEMLFSNPYAVLKHIKNTGVSTSQTQANLGNTVNLEADNKPFIWTKTSLQKFEKAYWQEFATKNDQNEDCVSLTYETLLISAIK